MNRCTALVIIALAAVATCFAPLPLHAQDYPARPIRFVVGFPPGSSTDIVSRLLAQKLQERLGQPLVVEQKVGATGRIANDFVAKSPPDGYNLVLLTGGHPVSAAIMKLPYDPVKDFGMVSTITAYPMVISVAPGSPVKSFDDLIARAKADPGKMTYSSNGVGSAHHLLGEWINLAGGISLVHVPFKGGGPALTDLLGGRIDLMIETATFTAPQVKGGRLRAIAVSSRSPASQFPGVPPIAETLPEIEFTSWLGVAVAPGTPASIVARLNREIRQVIDLPDMRQRFVDLGGESVASTPEEMRARIEREIVRWKRVVEQRSIPRE